MTLTPVTILITIVATVAYALDPPSLVVQSGKAMKNDLEDTDIVLAFVIFRHGDRTPDQEELDLYSAEKISQNVFFPYGMKALTNKGKQRAYRVGQYIRRRYNGLISKLYLPEEISVRTTDFARTKMTALVALSAIYPPTSVQKWNPALDWQPVPYDTPVYGKDDVLYWYNCPRYIHLRNEVYGLPEVKNRLISYQSLFSYLTEKTGNNITTPEDVFFLDNLFQTLENVGLKTPQWAQDVMPNIKEMTNIEYAIEFYTPELIQLATGVLMEEIINATSAAISGNADQPKLRLYSAHENNVAALMAAVKVFQPHQPKYGATFSVELRRSRTTGEYGVAAVYSQEAGGPEVILPIAGCGDTILCDYNTFIDLIKDTVWSLGEFLNQCPNGQ